MILSFLLFLLASTGHSFHLKSWPEGPGRPRSFASRTTTTTLPSSRWMPTGSSRQCRNGDEPDAEPKQNHPDQTAVVTKMASTVSDQQRRSSLASLLSVTASLATTTTITTTQPALAAPPIAIIAEELGYFPVTNTKNETVYIPRRVRRPSSEQAQALAQALTAAGAVCYTAYWCPHCARQKELFGRAAWQSIRNVECAPKGYGAQPALCLAKGVDGYPTWIIPKGNNGKPTVISGERPLSELAKAIGYRGFREELEENVPPPLGSSACK